MSNELKHHGVKGMKWGVRKDRKNATSTDSPNEANSSSKRKKRAIKIGIGATTGALAVIGTVKLSNAIRRDVGDIKNTVNDLVDYMN